MAGYSSVSSSNYPSVSLIFLILPLCLFVCPSGCLSFCLSICLTLSVCVCLFVRLSVSVRALIRICVYVRPYVCTNIILRKEHFHLHKDKNNLLKKSFRPTTLLQMLNAARKSLPVAKTGICNKTTHRHVNRQIPLPFSTAGGLNSFTIPLDNSLTRASNSLTLLLIRPLTPSEERW